MEKIRSRFIAEPSGKAFRVTAKDLAVLTLLQRYRYLPSSYIPVLLGWEGEYHKDLLRKLRHDAELIDCPSASWSAANARYRPAVYGLTKAGEQFLKARGLYVPHHKTGHEFNHELMVCLIQASFEIGAQAKGLQLITADEIISHPACPRATRNEREPWSVPVKFKYDGHAIEQNIESDGAFFGIAKKTPTGRASLIIPGFEADRRTEPLEPEAYERSSIKKKLLAYRAAASQGVYRSRYGIQSFVIPFITINETHKRSLMRVVDTLTEGKGSKLFIFKSFPNFASFENFPPATGHMLTEPWERVGHPPYNIVTELDNAGK